MSLLPFRKSRRLIAGSTNAVPAVISLMQAVVVDGLYDWITSDPYGRMIVQTPNILAYYRCNDANQAAGLVDAWGTANGTSQNGAYTGTGVTYGVAGVHGTGVSKGVRFDGVAGGASVALNLSAYSTITVEFWLNWTGTAGDNRIAMMFTNASQSFFNVPGSFTIQPTSAFATGGFEMSMGDGSGLRFCSAGIVTPSASTWHHYAITFNRNAGTIAATVDNVAQTVSPATQYAASATNFGSLTLWLMSDHGAAAFGLGSLQELVIYSGVLSSASIAAHWGQR